MKDTLLNIGAIVYILIGILTFGHSFNHINWTENVKVTGGRDLGAFGCGLGWPLYWSVQLFEKENK